MSRRPDEGGTPPEPPEGAPGGLFARLDIPPVWALAMAALSWLLDRFLPLSEADSGWAGPVLIGLGALLVLWGAWHLKRAGTPIEPRHDPKVLVRHGPYRINRNPIYTGMVLILFGWGLWLGSLGAVLPAFLYMWIVTRRFILEEEARIRRRFGEEGAAWLKRSRRW